MGKFEELKGELNRAPREKIYGVVSPSGVGAGRSRDESNWSLSFSLIAWGRPDSPIRKGKLSVQKEVADDELAKIRQQLPPYAVVTLELGLVEENCLNRPQALLYSVVDETIDCPDWQSVVEELKRPVTTEISDFGVFTLDKRFGSHEVETNWLKKPVRLSLENFDGDTFPAEALEHARSLWNEQKGWDIQIRDRIIEELLELKNDYWLGDFERKLSKWKFLKKIALKTVAIAPNGNFEFWYDDGDLFWGHSIMVSGSLVEGVTDAGIQG